MYYIITTFSRPTRYITRYEIHTIPQLGHVSMAVLKILQSAESCKFCDCLQESGVHLGTTLPWLNETHTKE